MAIAVVVPWRPGDVHRELAWRWVKNRYETSGFAVTVGRCPPGPWVKALAVQDAIDRTDADLLVVADADVWCPGLSEAIDRSPDAPVVVPHGKVLRLTERGTAEYIAGAKHPEVGEQHRGMEGGGVVVLRRDVWDRVPLDPRFVGWGQEDSSWGYALSAMTGKIRRFSAPLYHLWHPPQPRLNRATGSVEGRALEARYLAAASHSADMDALLSEARDALRRSRCR